jgi:iron complex outermembrane receptor protein
MLIACATTTLYAQDKFGYFEGVVTDKSTGETLIGANVKLHKNPAVGAIADLNGHFKIKLAPATYTFIISYTGMLADTVRVRIENGKTVFKKIQMEVYVSELQGVEVRAGHFNQKPEELTVSIEVIQPKFIESKLTTNIESVLDYVPGLNIINGAPQIRGGSGFSFGVGSKVGIFIDGIPMLTADANRPIWDMLPTDNIKQIEVIKGASSVLSGSSSLSGAIYITTADPPIKPVTHVKMSLGGYSTPKYSYMKWWNDFPYIGTFSISHAHAYKNTDIFVGFDTKLDHGYEGPPKPGPLVVDTVTDFTDEQMAEQRYRLNFNIRRRSKKVQGLVYGLNTNFMIHNTKLMLAWLDDSAGFYRAYPGGVILQNKTIFYLDPYATYFMAGGTKHSIKTRYLYENTDMSNGQNTQSEIYYMDYNFRKDYSVLGGFKFIGGISTQYNNVTSDMYVGSGLQTNNLLNISAYTEANKKFFESLNLSLGLRLEMYKLNGGVAYIKPVFRAGASLKVLQETYVRGSFGQGIRYPTIAEQFIRYSSGVLGVFENPDLVPETSTNAEIGLKQAFKFNKYFGYLDVSFFLQNYENTIEYIFGFWDSTYTFAIGGFKFVNTGKSRIVGIDISESGSMKLFKRLRVNTMVGYTYISPRSLEPDYVFAHDYSFNGGKDFTYENTSVNPDGQILKYRFLHTFKGDIEFEYKGLFTGLSMKYYSKLENLDKAIEDFEEATENMGGTMQPIQYMDYFYNENNGNFVMDFRLGYAFGEHHKLTLAINNITNRWYSIRPLKAESPRTIRLQYALKF